MRALKLLAFVFGLAVLSAIASFVILHTRRAPQYDIAPRVVRAPIPATTAATTAATTVTTTTTTTATTTTTTATTTTPGQWRVLNGPWPDASPDSNATTVGGIYYYNAMLQRKVGRVLVVGLLERAVFVAAVCQVSLDGGKTWGDERRAPLNAIKDYLPLGSLTLACEINGPGTKRPVNVADAEADTLDVHVRFKVSRDCLYRNQRKLVGPGAECAVPVDWLEFRHVLVEPRSTRQLVACVPSFHGKIYSARVRTWITYHLRMGVEHVFLYDMGADFDHTPLADLFATGVVSVRRLVLPRQYVDGHPDVRELNNGIWRADCLGRVQDSSTWGLFADVDEFVSFREPTLTLPAVIARSPATTSYISFGSLEIKIDRCVDPNNSSNEYWIPSDLPAFAANNTLWASPAEWPRLFPFRHEQAVCNNRQMTPNLCLHFYGHRKFVVDGTKVFSGLHQHTASMAGDGVDLSVDDAVLLHYRGFCTEPTVCHLRAQPEREVQEGKGRFMVIVDHRVHERITNISALIQHKSLI